MDAETMRRRAGELADRVARSVCSAQEAAEAATILRAVAAGVVGTTEPIHARLTYVTHDDILAMPLTVLVVSPDGVGVG